MVEEDMQMNIEDIEAAPLAGIGDVTVVMAVIEAGPMEQHSCCKAPALDFQDKFRKHRDFLECSKEQVPAACSDWKLVVFVGYAGRSM